MTARHAPTPIPRALLMTDAGEGHELPPLHGFLIPRPFLHISLWTIVSFCLEPCLGVLSDLSRMKLHLGSSTNPPSRT